MNSTESDIEKVKNLLEQLREILVKHGGKNYVSGVLSVLDCLADSDKTATEKIVCARGIYRRLLGGMGTLGDFAISCEDESMNLVLNQKLNDVLKELWAALGC